MPRARKQAPEPPTIQGPWQDAVDAAITWKDVDSQLLAAAVDGVTRLGHAVILGRTSDGGALSVCILAGASKPRVYADSGEAANLRLKQIVDWAVDLLSVANRI